MAAEAAAPGPPASPSQDLHGNQDSGWAGWVQEGWPTRSNWTLFPTGPDLVCAPTRLAWAPSGLLCLPPKPTATVTPHLQTLEGDGPQSPHGFSVQMSQMCSESTGHGANMMNIVRHEEWLGFWRTHTANASENTRRVPAAVRAAHEASWSKNTQEWVNRDPLRLL